jgi:hypothetical protein
MHTGWRPCNFLILFHDVYLQTESKDKRVVFWYVGFVVFKLSANVSEAHTASIFTAEVESVSTNQNVN